MTTEPEFDRRLRSLLREALDRESGPDAAWTESPAWRRISGFERRRGARWPLRILAVAAVLVVGGGALILGGALSRPRPPHPLDIPNGFMAYSVMDSPAGGDHDIYLVGLDRPAWRVAGTDSDDLDQICPAFSPDGRKLAYGEAQGTARHGVYRESRLVIVELDSDGNASPLRRVDLGGSLPPPCASWAPDGERLAFGAPRTSPLNPEGTAAGSAVQIVNLRTGGVTVLPDLLATHLEWSPDNATLGIASGKDQVSPGNALADGRIYLYEPQSGEVRAAPTPLGVYTFSWSPDGHRIVYETAGRLRIIDVRSGEDSVVTAGSQPVQGFDPVWSPAGTMIVYRRAANSESREPPAEAVLLELDGPNAATTRVLTSPNGTAVQGARSGFAGAERTVWSPDGAYVLCVGLWAAHGTTVVVAVPTDPNAPPVVLAEGDGISIYDAYDAVAPMVNQTWAREPARQAAS